MPRLALILAFVSVQCLGQAHSQIDIELDNDSTTGTVQFQLVKGVAGTSPLKVIKTTAGDTEAMGICIDRCGTTGKSLIILSGAWRCDFDGSVSARDFVQISPTADGKCHSAGANRPTSGRIVGRAIVTLASQGLAWVVLYGTGVDGSAQNSTEVAAYFSGCSGSQYLGADGACHSAGGGILPSGLVVLILSGSCPAGFTEVSALNGKFLAGTLAASGNVGTTGGSATITPVFTGTPFSSVINHTHAVNVTDPGHTHTTASTSYTERAQGGTTASTTGTHLMTSTATGGSLRNSAETTVAAVTTVNSAPTGITADTSNPAGGVASITPAGTIAAFDPSPGFTRVIFCSVN